MENAFHFKKAKFIKSIVDIKDSPNVDNFKEILFVGKSNVGKSSLINALLNNKNLAFTSSKPGHTKLLNYYLVEDYIYFVDSPGYGFSSKKGKDYLFYDKVIESYFDDNKNLSLIVFLLDSRHNPTDDDVLFNDFLKSKNYNFIYCLTKADKLNMKEKARIYKNLGESFIDYDKNKVNLVSIKNKDSILNLKKKIEEFGG